MPDEHGKRGFAELAGRVNRGQERLVHGWDTIDRR
jgi:hypothetical protein